MPKADFVEILVIAVVYGVDILIQLICEIT